MAAPAKRRRIEIALLSVPCITCGAKAEEDCKNQAPENVKRPRFHRARTELARRVGIEYIDTLRDIDELPEGVR
jgi:hypothetical protein